MHALRIHPEHAAALCAFAVDGIYLALIGRQDKFGESRVVFVAASIAAAGLAWTND
jgi:hypothetical protein